MKPVAQICISGSIPCVICGEAVTQGNFTRGDVLASVAKFIYPAHLIHFFTDNSGSSHQPDYKANLTRLAMVVSIGEGMDVPGMKGTLLPLYAELKTQMRNWNHPAFIIGPEQRN